jgi:hypothetical protein
MWYINTLAEPDVLLRDRMIHLIIRLTMVHQERHFSTTSNGYLGIGPCDIEVDDVVVLLAGATILRKKVHGLFWLVGTAYIHGTISGQAWPEDAPESWPKFDIV